LFLTLAMAVTSVVTMRSNEPMLHFSRLALHGLRQLQGLRARRATNFHGQ
jgi:hypothetical protein